jgi:TonB family protein
MNHYFPTSQAVSRRSVALGGIAGLHVLVVYMFASGLAVKMIPAAVQSIDATVMVAPREKPTAPPPPQPTMRRVPLDEQPVPPLIVEQGPIRDGFTVNLERPVPVQPQHVEPPAPPPVRVLGQNRFPNSEDYYPAGVRRLGIEGYATVRACVDENGRLVEGSPSVERSSGNARLDAGALNVARAGRYARSVQGTTPVPNCFRFNVDFQMR